ncbi:MAG: aldo/keto reductase [Anaerolineales bacterium]|jgi:aryl-alcohol dehydrogenase-like predicted oxidoreductase
MEYRNLGRTGLRVSELCLGTMQFGWTADKATSYEILSQAFDQGINFIDTADVYSRWAAGNPGGISEEILGEWMSSHNIDRTQVILATKVRGTMGPGPNDEGLSRAHILTAVEGSLRRMKTDYIDLYQTHWYDENTPIEETLSALDDLVRQGKVRYAGCSNYTAWRLMQALWYADRDNLTRYDSLQPHYSLVHRKEFEQELAQICREYGLGVIPYSPLGGGFLTGKYDEKGSEVESERANGVKKHFSQSNWLLLEKMKTIGVEKSSKTISQIALAWLLSDPLITSPIIGPRTLEQLQDNLGAVGLRLTPEEKNTLDQASSSN